jgi:hypothetical protein
MWGLYNAIKVANRQQFAVYDALKMRWKRKKLFTVFTNLDLESTGTENMDNGRISCGTGNPDQSFFTKKMRF